MRTFLYGFVTFLLLLLVCGIFGFIGPFELALVVAVSVVVALGARRRLAPK
jgi:hypothetical protein